MADPFEALSEVVAPQILLDAINASRRLSELGVRHALIGGLAVGVHGHPRATRDVDFLVGSEAFESTSPLLVYRDELSELVQLGVIDLLSVPADFPTLTEHLQATEPGQVPVIPIEALVLLKLHADRPQDRADVTALLESGVDTAEIAAYLRERAPKLAARFAELAPAPKSEEDADADS